MNPCDSNETERFSGQIDWGDGTASDVDPGDFTGKDRGKLLTQPHAYTKPGVFSVFVHVRAQCLDHGQSTRTIACGGGTVHVR